MKGIAKRATEPYEVGPAGGTTGFGNGGVEWRGGATAR